MISVHSIAIRRFLCVPFGLGSLPDASVSVVSSSTGTTHLVHFEPDTETDAIRASCVRPCSVESCVKRLVRVRSWHTPLYCEVRLVNNLCVAVPERPRAPTSPSSSRSPVTRLDNSNPPSLPITSRLRSPKGRFQRTSSGRSFRSVQWALQVTTPAQSARSWSMQRRPVWL